VIGSQQAGAATIKWNTCEGGSDNLCVGNTLPESGRSSSGTGVDQVLTFDAIGDPGKDLTARAFQTTTNLGTGFVLKTQIRIFDGGLGAGPESSPQHSVDNIGVDEFIVFQLPANAYQPTSFRIGWKETDADISTWIGGTLGGLDDAFALLLAGNFNWDATGGSLTATHGYVQQTFLDVATNTDMLFTNNATGRYLIIGARNEVDNGRYDGGEDKFKLLQIVADEPKRVPFPASLVLLASAFVAIAVIDRRRAQRALTGARISSAIIWR
jgi:hypothetical protein